MYYVIIIIFHFFIVTKQVSVPILITFHHCVGNSALARYLKKNGKIYFANMENVEPETDNMIDAVS